VKVGLTNPDDEMYQISGFKSSFCLGGQGSKGFLGSFHAVRPGLNLCEFLQRACMAEKTLNFYRSRPYQVLKLELIIPQDMRFRNMKSEKSPYKKEGKKLTSEFSFYRPKRVEGAKI
jgi:hypothetical protein